MTKAIEPLFPLAGRRLWVTGHSGMVGAALLRRLAQEECEVVTVGREKVDLRRQADVEAWVAETRPEAIILAAATVGGILANDTRPAEFIYDNLAIEANVIHTAWRMGVRKLLFLGSSCVYPRLAPQPMREEALLAGELESTNQYYAIAKIAGIKLCQAYRRQYGCDFICAMPTNLYGAGDHFDAVASHVVPALILKIHQAKMHGWPTVELWGDGTPRREFLYVDDLADALIFLMRHYSDEQHINVGTGKDIAIRELAEMIAGVVGFDGHFTYDGSKPQGTARKLLDVTRITRLGWQPTTDLLQGIERTYSWFLAHVAPLSSGIAHPEA